MTERKQLLIDVIALVPAIAAGMFVYDAIGGNGFFMAVFRFLVTLFCSVGVWALVVDGIHEFITKDKNNA